MTATYNSAYLAAGPGEAIGMGIGALGDNTLVFKRKFRWTMSIEYCVNGGDFFIPEEFIKMGKRPSLDIEETQVDYLNGRFWVPGKGTWNEIEVQWYDVAGSNTTPIFKDAELTNIYGWIASVYDITNPTTLHQGSGSDYQGNAVIFLYDGCGNALEGWLLTNMFPSKIDFGELDMESSDFCMISLTMRYANVQYQSYCPDVTLNKCACTDCDEE